MTTATFTNGETETYTGKRNVSHAWQITFSDRTSLTGVSASEAAASNTAKKWAGFLKHHKNAQIEVLTLT